jgi:5'-3' exonuclease
MVEFSRRCPCDAGIWRHTERRQVVICTPDKDLAQCVRGDRVVQLDRRTRELRNEAGVVQKFGVPPASIPDWLALVGDSADGYPGLPGWGSKSASALLSRYGHLDAIPDRRPSGTFRWRRGRARPASAWRRPTRCCFVARRSVRTSLEERVDDLDGPERGDELVALCRDIGDEESLQRVQRWRAIA